MFLLLFLLRSVRSTRAPVLDLLASVLQAAKPLIYFGSAQAPAPINRTPRREIVSKAPVRVARHANSTSTSRLRVSGPQSQPKQFLA